MSENITLRKLPGESTSDFIARIVAARPPLTGEEKAALRTIFRPVIEAPEPHAPSSVESTAA
ncbi:hypothetical protein AQI95_21135 [Streptomyces yokosukanensis]|uniref:Uncharacterized protein n=1 Tax=Streptomyces yokosukanensis TaxID=67386 RepID=A0A101P2X6_9ACTN|nr:hypothetical protein [Streptomyces yokosukanensis]KUN03946.1 hypothetical protein AQI95_21135 [Streptomyces yokosukanensis]